MLERILAFLGGLLAGSFLNVCIYRLPRDLSVVRPRSFCPNCEKQVAWFDNIPLLSYVLLQGRCRHCQHAISARYPIVELMTGAAFLVAVATYGLTWPAAKFGLFSAILITLIASDIEERILPDEFTLGGLAIGLVLSAFVPLHAGLAQFLLPPNWSDRWMSVAEAVLGAGVSSGAIWLVGELYYRIRHREGLGFGDVKMVAMIGAFLGLQGALLTLMFGSLLGAVAGLIFILLTGKNASTYELPFGSFLGMAAMVVAVFGEIVVAWYQRAGA